VKAGNDMFYCRARVIQNEDGSTAAWSGEERPCRRVQQELRDLIDVYLKHGWLITNRYPLTIYRGRAGYQLQNGCLVSV